MNLRFAKRTRTEQFTVETDQVVVIRRSRVTKSWCSQRQDFAEFIPVEEINRMIDGGIIPPTPAAIAGLHFGKARDGSTVICTKSLFNKP